MRDKRVQYQKEKKAVKLTEGLLNEEEGKESYWLEKFKLILQGANCHEESKVTMRET